MIRGKARERERVGKKRDLSMFAGWRALGAAAFLPDLPDAACMKGGGGSYVSRLACSSNSKPQAPIDVRVFTARDRVARLASIFEN